MIVGEFAGILTQKGCVGNGKSFCGSFNGYPFTCSFISGSQTGKTVASLQIEFNKKVPKKMIKAITKLHRGQVKAFYPNRNYGTAYLLGGVLGAAIVASTTSQVGGTNQVNILSLQITARSPEEMSNLIDSVLATTVSKSVEFGLSIPNICPLCKQANCDSYGYVKNSYHAVHANCVQNDLAAHQMKHEKNARTGNYGLGLLGAILGLIIGCAVIGTLIGFLAGLAATISLALAGLLYFISYAAYILPPIFIFYGYRLLNGKMDKPAYAIIIPLSIISMFFFEYFLLMGTSLVISPSLYLPSIYLSKTIEQFASSSNLTDAFDYYFFPLLATVLGAIIACTNVSKNGKQGVLDKSFAAATLRPISAFASPVIQQAPIAPAPMPTANQQPIVEVQPPTMPE